MFILYKKTKSEKEKRRETKTNAESWPRKEVNLIFDCLSSIYTLTAFVLASSLIPSLVFFYFVTSCIRSSFIRWLERKYPQLEFIGRSTARTIVDTPRNQCIISLLLTVQGECQIQLIKNRVKEEIVERRRGNKYLFPHLKTRLTKRWTKYAWIKGSDREFRLENHVLLAPSTFKGRPITEANIQEVTSDLIAKMLPPEVPPWQILVIPAVDRAYLLIRLHHLYLSEEGLTLDDILIMQPNATYQTIPVLDGVFQPPVVIPRVYSALSETTSNMWNEIVSQYDPIEKPEVVKHPSLKSCFFLTCIVVFASVKAYFSEEKQSINSILETEMQKRCLSLALLTESFFNTFSLRIITNLLLIGIRLPFEMMKFPIRMIKLILDTPTWPLTVDEDSLPQMLSALNQSEVYLYWLYLGHYVVQELIYIFKVVYKAPRVLFEELFLPERPANVHHLQTLSFCGRKVVSWSESVPKDVIKQICFATGATEREVLLAALAGSLRNYFVGAQFSLPDNIMTTCQFTPKGELPGSSSKGFLCLPLPLLPSHPLACLEAVKKSLFAAKEAQTVLYLASDKGLDTSFLIGVTPSLFAKAALYLLSRRYAVTVSMVEGTSDCSLLWGQPVRGIMYWSPPQANVCLSITFMTYGDSVTLGVMADAQLSPHHNDIPIHFPNCIRSMAASLGVQYPQTSTA